ncbi:MAG: AbiV family abortive infection protein [Promethearchaeota archaeon]
MVRNDIKELIAELRTYDPEKLVDLGLRTYDNAVDLVDEALVLVGQHSYARGFFLSFTAFEELGKAYYVCLLGHQILGGVSKADLTEWYKQTASLFRFHPEKIKAAGLTRLVIDFFEKESLKRGEDREFLRQDINDLDKKDIPSIVSYTRSLVEPMITWMSEQLVQPSDTEDEDFVSMDLRNRSLYVNIPTTSDDPTI